MTYEGGEKTRRRGSRLWVSKELGLTPCASGLLGAFMSAVAASVGLGARQGSGPSVPPLPSVRPSVRLSVCLCHCVSDNQRQRRLSVDVRLNSIRCGTATEDEWRS